MRRVLLYSLLAVFPMLGIASCDRKQAASAPATRYLTVCSYGGAFQDAQRKAFFEPFTAATGIEIREDKYGGEYAKIKMMVESSAVTWDVVDVESDMLLRGAVDNLFEPLDFQMIDATAFPSEAVHANGIATDFFSTGLAYNTTRLPAGRRPISWKDFWDIERFPGPRALRRDPRSTLEIALLADGVSPEALYPLDVARALRSLDRIKPAVTVWWTSGHQPAELLASGEVTMAASFTARIWVASQKEGKPLAFTWNQAIIDPEWWAIPRGSSKRDLALQFIAFASRAENQARFPQNIGLGPSNPKAFEQIPSDLSKQLNTYPENRRQQILSNAAWWAHNYKSAQEAFLAWLGQAK